MKDFKIPVAMVTFLAAQAGGMVWFLSGIQNRVQALEGERLNNVEVYLTNPVGIGEHSNIVEAIEEELNMIAKYEDQVEVIKKYFKK